MGVVLSCFGLFSLWDTRQARHESRLSLSNLESPCCAQSQHSPCVSPSRAVGTLGRELPPWPLALTPGCSGEQVEECQGGL